MRADYVASRKNTNDLVCYTVTVMSIPQWSKYSANGKLLIDVQHKLWSITLNGRLFTAPLPSRPSSVLDIGCGSGTWAQAFATANPACHVVGIDLAPPSSEASRTAPNCTFVQGNLEDASSLQALGTFDYIRGCLLTLGIKDWAQLFRLCYRLLKPGGYIEIIDMQMNGESLTGYDASNCAFLKHADLWLDGTAKRGIDWNAKENHPPKLRAAAFEDLEQQLLRWPFGQWPDDEREKEMGRIVADLSHKMLDTGPRRLKEVWPDMQEQELEELRDQARTELDTRAGELKMVKYLLVECSH